MTILSEPVRQELSELYNVEGRYYHGLSHVESLLSLLDECRESHEFLDIDAVEAAIWFHDAIYDSKSKDNELKSAELAVARLSESISDKERLDRIYHMILATATHTVPGFTDPRARADAALFLDMDLSILGADTATFNAYEVAVREEYNWATDEQWRAGRTAVLRSFLDRKVIFHSSLLRNKCEDSARRNIGHSLKKLENES
jgi:predicted metal-dependent HD superfamily phosphohydrolase